MKDIIIDVLRRSTRHLMTGEIISRSKAYPVSRLGDRSIRKSLVALLQDRVIGRTKIGSSQRYFLRNQKGSNRKAPAVDKLGDYNDSLEEEILGEEDSEEEDSGEEDSEEEDSGEEEGEEDSGEEDSGKKTLGRRLWRRRLWRRRRRLWRRRLDGRSNGINCIQQTQLLPNGIKLT